MPEYITVKTFNFAYETLVLKSILQSRGIRFLFQNENLIAIDPLASYAYGGILLKIHPNDFEETQSILDNLNTKLDIV